MINKYHVGLKTLREKEKLLITSNFSFSHNVFQSYISLVRQNVALCGNGLNSTMKAALKTQMFSSSKFLFFLSSGSREGNG